VHPSGVKFIFFALAILSGVHANAVAAAGRAESHHVSALFHSTPLELLEKLPFGGSLRFYARHVGEEDGR
jgi:hypothetical protein